MAKVIELQDVELRQSEITILRDISLQLSSDDRLVIMGPSGGGKSTLLRVLAGLVQPTAGCVVMDGQPLHQISPANRDIALLSQDYALYPQLSVQQNLQVALGRRSLSRVECAERVERIAAQFDISDVLERLPSQISGGQAQRAAIAKALLRRPKLLLLDEPLSQLDFRLREQLIQLILAASSQLGIGLCWVAHDPLEAFRIASRIGILDRGRVIQCGAPEEVYRHPRNRLVADTLSCLPINWLTAESPEFASVYKRVRSTNAIVGIRPEAWRVVSQEESHSAGNSDSEQFVVNLTVEESCFFGQTRLAWGRLGAHRILLQLDQRILQPGAIVRLASRFEEMIWTDG